MTTIHVERNVWKVLNTLKEPGESMNDVIKRLLRARPDDNSYLSEPNSNDFDKIVEEFVSVLSDELLVQTIEQSRRSFSKRGIDNNETTVS